MAPGVEVKKVPVKVSPTLRNLTHLSDSILVPLLLVSFISGWVASLSGLTEYGLHKWSSVALMVLATAHLYLHWRMFKVHGKALATKGSGVIGDVNENQERMFPPTKPANWGRVAFIFVLTAIIIVVFSHSALSGPIIP